MSNFRDRRSLWRARFARVMTAEITPNFMEGPEKLASQRLRRRAVAQAASALEGDDVGSLERLLMQMDLSRLG